MKWGFKWGAFGKKMKEAKLVVHWFICLKRIQWKIFTMNNKKIVFFVFIFFIFHVNYSFVNDNNNMHS